MLTHLGCACLFAISSFIGFTSFLPHTWRLHHPAKGAPNRSPHLATLCMVLNQLPQRSFHKDLWVSLRPAVLISMASRCIRKQRPSSLTTPFLMVACACNHLINDCLASHTARFSASRSHACVCTPCEYTQLAFN